METFLARVLVAWFAWSLMGGLLQAVASLVVVVVGAAGRQARRGRLVAALPCAWSLVGGLLQVVAPVVVVAVFVVVASVVGAAGRHARRGRLVAALPCAAGVLLVLVVVATVTVLVVVVVSAAPCPDLAVVLVGARLVVAAPRPRAVVAWLVLVVVAATLCATAAVVWAVVRTPSAAFPRPPGRYCPGRDPGGPGCASRGVAAFRAHCASGHRARPRGTRSPPCAAPRYVRVGSQETH